jgi:hypothetical protein
MAEEFPTAPKHPVFYLPTAPTHKPVRRGMKFTDKERDQLLRTAFALQEQNKKRVQEGKTVLPFAPEELEAIREQKRIDKINYDKNMMERIQVIEEMNRIRRSKKQPPIPLKPEEREWKEKQSRIDRSLRELLPSTTRRQSGKGRGKGLRKRNTKRKIKSKSKRKKLILI